MSIKAIETSYNGYRFRSRTEARWAVFFDAAGIKYEYEKEGFELPSGRYLPDFWLPTLDAWFEVKGGDPTKSELALAVDLYRATGKDVWLSSGQPRLDGEFIIVGLGMFESMDAAERDIGASFSHWPVMHNYGLAWMPDKVGPICLFHGAWGFAPLRTGRMSGGPENVPLGEAFNAAKSARFEFGESGAANYNLSPDTSTPEKIIDAETIQKMVARHKSAHRKRARFDLEWIEHPWGEKKKA